MPARAGVRPIIGVATIGQTPRPDLETAFGAAAPHAEVRVVGALDGLAPAAIADLAHPGPYPLLVRLADGRTAEIARDVLAPLVARATRALADGGATVVVVACAGGFTAFPCPVPLLLPGRLLPAAVRAMAAGARIGIVTPNGAQMPFAAAKWHDDGFEVVVTSALPADSAAMTAAAAEMRRQDVAMVVLDCMGHDERSRAEFARLSGRPTIAALPLTAALAAAIV